MMYDFFSFDYLSITRNLIVQYGYIALVTLRSQETSERMQHVDDGSEKLVVTGRRRPSSNVTDHAEIDIASVVKDSTAAGVASCQN